MNTALTAIIAVLGGAYAAADAADISPAWMYRCIERGRVPVEAAVRLLSAAEAVEPGKWPLSRLAELTVTPAAAP